MKMYQVTVSILRLREKASAQTGVKILKTFKKGEKFFSDQQEVNALKEKWARVVNELNQPIGWTQISNLKDENAKEIALPSTPPIMPTMTEPAGGLSLGARLDALEAWAEKNGYKK